VRESLGLDNSRPDFPPINYPSTQLPFLSNIVPNRPRSPPEGFEDPPADKLEPVWYRTHPPKPIRAALESQGVNWEDALKDLEARRDAMIEGDEWDVSIDNGKIVWNKPSEATLKKRVESELDLRTWGTGWRKGVVWAIWKILGSPEGVFETEDGSVDGKLVLRDLQKERSGRGGTPEGEQA